VQELGFRAVVRCQFSVAGFESPDRFGSDDGAFVHGRQRNSTTEAVQRPFADGAARRQPLSPRAPEQVLFRTVNEEIDRLAKSFGLDSDLELVCECRDRDCLVRLSVSRAEFDAVRSVSARFVVAADHVTPTETVVRRGDRYKVIEDRRRESDRSVNAGAAR
jgi:hypothetical protein